MEICPACGADESWIIVTMKFKNEYQFICTACGQISRVNIEGYYRD